MGNKEYLRGIEEIKEEDAKEWLALDNESDIVEFIGGLIIEPEREVEEILD